MGVVHGRGGSQADQVQRAQRRTALDARIHFGEQRTVTRIDALIVNGMMKLTTTCSRPRFARAYARLMAIAPMLAQRIE